MLAGTVSGVMPRAKKNPRLYRKEIANPIATTVKHMDDTT